MALIKNFTSDLLSAWFALFFFVFDFFDAVVVDGFVFVFVSSFKWLFFKFLLGFSFSISNVLKNLSCKPWAYRASYM